MDVIGGERVRVDVIGGRERESGRDWRRECESGQSESGRDWRERE